MPGPIFSGSRGMRPTSPYAPGDPRAKEWEKRITEARKNKAEVRPETENTKTIGTIREFGNGLRIIRDRLTGKESE